MRQKSLRFARAGSPVPAPIEGSLVFRLRVVRRLLLLRAALCVCFCGSLTIILRYGCCDFRTPGSCPHGQLVRPYLDPFLSIILHVLAIFYGGSSHRARDACFPRQPGALIEEVSSTILICRR